MNTLLDLLSQALTWLDPYAAPWWSVGGVPMSQLESLACVLSLWMVWLNFRVNPWAWPLAITSSLMYGALFARSRLYGEATLQLVFVVLALWGWASWLRGQPSVRGDAGASAGVGVLSRSGRVATVLVWLALWPVLAWLLGRYTDSDVPWWDALPTAGSLVGQWLLARKRLENWLCWLVVNLVSVGLFAHKQLWLTVILYAIFAVLSVWGWLQWRQRLRAPEAMSRAGAA